MKNTPYLSRVRPFRIMIPFGLLVLTSCETGRSPPPPLPTCQQLAEILNTAGDEFEAIRSGPKMYVGGSARSSYWNTTKVLQGTDYCRIRDFTGIGIRYECAWSHGNQAEMGAHYRALRDRVISCVGEVTVNQNDANGRTTVQLHPPPELEALTYIVQAQYQRFPFGLAFAIQTRK